LYGTAFIKNITNEKALLIGEAGGNIKAKQDGFLLV